MNVNLENIDLESIIESAVLKTLTSSLAKNLPSVIDKMLTVKPGYNDMSLINKTINETVKLVVNRCVNEFITSKQDEIAIAVQKHLEVQFQPEVLSKMIATQLASMSIKIQPFKVASIKEDEEED